MATTKCPDCNAVGKHGTWPEGGQPRREWVECERCGGSGLIEVVLESEREAIPEAGMDTETLNNQDSAEEDDDE